MKTQKKCEIVKKERMKKTEFVDFTFSIFSIALMLIHITRFTPRFLCVYSTKKLSDRVIHTHRIEKVKYKRRKIDWK